jgi:hypothetical protein
VSARHKLDADRAASRAKVTEPVGAQTGERGERHGRLDGHTGHPHARQSQTRDRKTEITFIT